MAAMWPTRSSTTGLLIIYTWHEFPLEWCSWFGKKGSCLFDECKVLIKENFSKGKRSTQLS
jgi:hypothetical protein